MFRIDKEGKRLGVLTDWDLTSNETRPPRGRRRFGSVPFMPVIFLDPTFAGIDLQHFYRHDLESQFWMLMWMAARSGTFNNWVTGDSIYGAKLNRLRISLFPARNGFENLRQRLVLPSTFGVLLAKWNDNMVYRVLWSTESLTRRRMREALFAVCEEKFGEPTIEEVWAAFYNWLAKAHQSIFATNPRAEIGSVLGAFLAYNRSSDLQ